MANRSIVRLKTGENKHYFVDRRKDTMSKTTLERVFKEPLYLVDDTKGNGSTQQTYYAPDTRRMSDRLLYGKGS